MSERRLSAEELSAVRSNFLDTGWREQAYEIASIEWSPERIVGKIDVVRFMPAQGDDPDFYLSTTLATPVLGQLGVIHAVTALGAKKSFPVWSRDYQIENHRRVRKAKGIEFAMECYERFISAPSEESMKEQGVRHNFRYRFSVEGGAFTGSAWFVFRAR